MRDTEINAHARWIDEAYGRYLDSPAVAAGSKLAERLLNYRATTPITALIQIEHAMAALRANGVDARKLLVRVAAVYAELERRPGRYNHTQRAEDYALARLVLRLGPPRKRRDRRPSAKLLRFLGQLTRDYCGTFALGLLRQIREDNAEEAELRKLSATFRAPEVTA